MPAPAKSKRSGPDRAARLAQRLVESLVRDRVVPRFVDSYVIEHGRYGLQVHAVLYRDLLSLIQREALLAASACALDLLGRPATARDDRKFRPISRKDASAFRQKFLAALARQQQWNAGSALEFQSDLQMYEAILAKAAQDRRRRKPFEAANHPFVDRCAFLLDSSFLENARLAASRALTTLEELAARETAQLFSETA
ncbi:MAG TPA: hypothetical protein VMH31_11895 [Methylomirabilota bacterium]|nr:hypothetical protein [Methylomirabilota bacterium]